jgi:hypothetical protein
MAKEEEGKCECSPSAAEVVNESSRRKRKLLTDSVPDIECVKKAEKEAVQEKEKKKIALVYVVGAIDEVSLFAVIKISHDVLTKEQLRDLGNANSTDSMESKNEDDWDEHENNTSGIIGNLLAVFRGSKKIEGYKALTLEPNLVVFNPEKEVVMATYALWFEH